MEFSAGTSGPFLLRPARGMLRRGAATRIRVVLPPQKERGLARAAISIAILVPGHETTRLTARAEARILPRKTASRDGHPVAGDGAPPKIKEAYWNGWLREQGRAEETATVVRTHSYDVNFDLAAYNYALRAGTGAGSVVVDPTFLKELNDVTGETLPIVVKPFLLGRGLTFQPGRARTQSLDLKLERLRKPPTDFTRDDSLPVFADKVTALRVTVGVEATGSGCAAVGLSIWNAAANRPLDYIVREIPVTDPEAPGPPASCGTGNAKSRG